MLLREGFRGFCGFVGGLSLVAIVLTILAVIYFASMKYASGGPTPTISSATTSATMTSARTVSSARGLVRRAPVPGTTSRLFSSFLFGFTTDHGLRVRHVRFPLTMCHGSGLGGRVRGQR